MTSGGNVISPGDEVEEASASSSTSSSSSARLSSNIVEEYTSTEQPETRRTASLPSTPNKIRNRGIASTASPNPKVLANKEVTVCSAKYGGEKDNDSESDGRFSGKVSNGMGKGVKFKTDVDIFLLRLREVGRDTYAVGANRSETQGGGGFGNVICWCTNP
mmetsp:Transcript_38632/g.52373  ORF Transcript_38632/g.52373 Transcript_38632/m.52373 type:complete len:161 (-) Transcript_38632:6-488(-)